MAENEVRIKVTGDSKGVKGAMREAARDAKAEGRKAGDTFGSEFGKAAKVKLGMLDLGIAAAGLAPAAIGAALPALGSLALQFGVVKLALKANNAESQAFKKQLEDLKKPIQDLQNTAGKAFLPGATKFLKDSVTLFPTLNGAVERTGKIMGDTAARMGDLFKTDKFKADLDGFLRSTEPVTQAIGDLFVQLTGKLVEFGAKMAPAGQGFATFIRDAGDGISGLLDGLAPHADDFKSIFESLGSIVKDVLPLIGQLAGEMSEQLAPILRDLAGFIDRNKDAISAWMPFLAKAAVGLLGLRIASAVTGPLSGLAGAIFDLGGKSEGASGKVGRLVTKLGGIKGIAGAAALGAVAVGMDQVNASSEQGNLSGWNGELHDLVRVMTGDWGNALGDMSAQLDTWKRNLQAGFNTDGSSNIGKFFGWLRQQMNDPLPPIKFDVDTGPGQAQVSEFLGNVNRSAGTVNINGNENPAGFALREILSEIDAGKATVTIDGRPMPAQDALKYVVGMINNSAGTVTVNGQTQPAGAALAAILGRVNGSRADIGVGANTSAANGAIAGLVNNWNGRHINLIVTTTGSGGIASAGRLATGGPVKGPGTGTSDTAGLFALSNGEHVASAKQVRNAGGQGAFGRLMAALDRGPVTGLAAGGPAGSPTRAPAPSPGGGGVAVTFTGNTSDALATVIMQLVRTGKIQLKAA